MTVDDDVYAKVGGKGYGRMRQPGRSELSLIEVDDAFRLQLPIVHIVDMTKSVIATKNRLQKRSCEDEPLKAAVAATFRGCETQWSIQNTSGSEHISHSR